jgi:ribosomal protein L28
MAKICYTCGKKYNKAIAYSWLRASNRNPTAIRRQHPNLQSATIEGKKVKICTKCMKNMHKIKKVKATSSKKNINKVVKKD